MISKILVTGAGGFIGFHLTELLVNKGFQVKALVHYNSKNNWGWLENSSVRNEIEVVTGDIRDFDCVFSAMKNCSAVFHLAALIGIPYSYISPKAYIETNITGTYNVLESAKHLGTEQILITSTSETYGTAQYVPIDEKHPAVGQSPYSATKIAADQIALSYFLSFGLPVKIVRPFNTFGPRQSARAVIPTIISQIIYGKKELKLGNLHPTRDLTFVKDTANGFLEIFKSENCFGIPTNIGMAEETSIKDLALTIAKLMNTDITFLKDTERIRPEKSEVERLFCDNSRIKEITNWRPNYTLESGLKETIEWIVSNSNIYKPEVYNV